MMGKQSTRIRGCRWSTVVAVVMTAAAGCSSGSRTSSTTVAAAPTSTTAPSVAAGSQDLGSLVLPAPTGYAVSTAADVKNGPVSADALDQAVGQPGTAESLHFVSGYDLTYDDKSTPDSVEVVLAKLATTADASSFLGIAVTSAVDPGEVPNRRAVPAIPGAMAIDGTKPTSDGFYDHAVVATKGVLVFALTYSTKVAGPAPSLLTTWARQQYQLL